MMGWMHGYGYGFGGGWLLVCGLLFILFVGGLAVLGAVLFGVFGRSGGKGSQQAALPPAGNQDAVQILKQRYARGDIDKEEYQRKLEDLTGSGQGPG